jgi:zinc protease
LFADTLPAGSPYHLVQGGKRKTVEKLATGDLQQYHARYFVPNNMIVTVFGDIDPEKSLALVKKLFGGLKPAADFRPLSFQRSNALGETIVRHKAIAKQTAMVLLGYPTASIFQKEEHAAMTLLGAVMAGYHYPGGWLHTELRGEGLVYAVHALQVTGPVPGYFEILAQTRPDKLDEVVARIERNVARAKEGRISPDEFRTAAERVIALHAQENTTIAEQAQQAALDELYGLGYDYHKSFDARIQAVKLKDVVAAARKYFGNHVLVTSSPEKGKK